jgi:hypothetical protein
MRGARAYDRLYFFGGFRKGNRFGRSGRMVRFSAAVMIADGRSR